MEAPSRQGGQALAGKIRRQSIIWAIRIGFVLITALVWESLTSFHLEPAVFVGTPLGTLEAFVSQFRTSIVTVDLGTTLYETIAGFIIGSGLGLVAGILLAQSELVKEGASPLFTAANSLPRVTLAPLFILWFGLGSTSKIVLVISTVFFIMVLSTVAGLTLPDPDREVLARTLGASRIQRLRLFVLPGALPTLMAGLELSLIYSFLAAVVGEFVGGATGLGVRLEVFANEFAINKFFAVIILLALVTTILAYGLQMASRRATRWYNTGELARKR